MSFAFAYDDDDYEVWQESRDERHALLMMVYDEEGEEALTPAQRNPTLH